MDRWYEAQSLDARASAWPKVEAELRRRNDTRKAEQERIAELEQRRLQALTKVALAREQLTAAELGLAGEPLGKDPRLVSARAALRDVKKRLQAALKRRRQR